VLATAEAALEAPLPISVVLSELLDRLAAAGAAVLVSPPGTGKTTLVPLALADADRDRSPGRVVVAEPRRMAARAAATRMAALLGEPVGRRVGYAVRGERRVGPAPRVEVVTTGLLVQRLQRDPELPGVTSLVLDEVHERHLDSDLALAFVVDVRASLRDDLRVLATSATADAERLAGVLGPGTPVVGADAALHPVGVVWCPPTGPIQPPRGLRVDPRFLDHVAAVVRRALAETLGDVLVFLPGAAEIGAVAARLAGVEVDVLRLHGRMSGGDQDAVLRPGPRRRVVLASAVAESSLTVPGVRTVVDCGLARVPRMDLARGLGALVTVAVSRSAAHQRAGRAGRQGPGHVYRCWSAADHDRLPAHPQPEVATADLTGFVLALARWGDPDAASPALLDRPPASGLAVARQTLQALDAVDPDGRITARGRRIAGLGVHPRLARALLDGGPRVGARRASEIVAMLAEDTLGGDDLAEAWRRLRAGADPAASARWREEVRRLRRDPAEPVADPSIPDDLAVGLVTGLAYPERLARARPGGYLMAGGTAAELPPGSALSGAGWLAVAEAQRQPGAAAARVRSAAAIDEDTAREAGASLLAEHREVAWLDGDVVARSTHRLGAILLRERPLRDPPTDKVASAVADGLRREGLDLLSWTPTAVALRSRLAFLRSALGRPWPDVSDPALLAAVPDWLGPELTTARRRADLAAIDVSSALRRLLPYRQAARLDELAPERIEVPSGSRVRVAYSDHYADPGTPVLAVKLQETFGWASAPRIADGRVPVVLHLLSPAGRPVAVTADLESFWRNAYPDVRAELRGRYPRHPWPTDPATAVPTRRIKPRRG
jgi:ATP-dependent helicase HrpB